MDNRKISILIPILNEQESIGYFVQSANEQLIYPHIEFELIFIDDGSSDSSVEVLKNITSKLPIRVLKLSRNFGKDNAICAGFERCDGDAAIVMDVDMQDPIEVVLQMIPKWLEGYSIVNGKRATRSGESWLKRTSAYLFYKLINKMTRFDVPKNVGDFKLIDRKAIEVINLMPEKVRFFKGISAWVGFRQCDVTYARPERFAGQTQWNYFKLWNFALDGFTSFSSAPLKIWTYIGFAVSTLSFSYGVFTLIKALKYGMDVPGYASLVVIMTFLFGVVLIGLGIVGEYIARIYEEVKSRPVYVLESDDRLNNEK